MTRNNYTIALAGNPNTGKSTLFNVLTGLRQHTGNWPGKTVVHAEGFFTYKDCRYKLVDLPGTYSLYSNSADEEVARDFIIFEKPDATIVVLDATALERNLNLALQVLEMTDRVIVCVNLMDEAKKKGIRIDPGKLSASLGVPVIPISARNKEGIDVLLETLDQMVHGKIKTDPIVVRYGPDIERRIHELIPSIKELFGDAYPARWVALRLLDGDTSLLRALQQRSTRLRKEAVSHADHHSAASV
ncbi:FeoB small GTPase domain-containing protein [Saccharococcus thermophilus]|uniref:Small GTP-binding protein n=1 Tax=Saccharococcus thermophilus TaxID=29396 RepID=A0A846MI26_9BACL|nr:FeoB small GTPase domain-containing protein [Saccharococcus thermophilus]NIK14964.1 small GTP-binding protein [Saccharococcus thermophilus]